MGLNDTALVQISPRVLFSFLAVVGVLHFPTGVPAVDPPAGKGDIRWFEVDPNQPPSKFVEWKHKLLTTIEPMRRKVFGDPPSVITGSFIVTLRDVGAAAEAIPEPDSVHTNGLAATLLSASSFKRLHQRLNSGKGVGLLVGPGVQSLSGQPVKVVVSQASMINPSAAPFGLNLNLIPRAKTRVVDTLIIAELTDAVSDAKTGSVSIVTNLSCGVRADVPHGGGLVVWNTNAVRSGSFQFLVVAPLIQTNAVVPPAGAKLVFKPRNPPSVK
jgi:hypothetical protein